jgi:hypothetical protein
MLNDQIIKKLHTSIYTHIPNEWNREIFEFISRMNVWTCFVTLTYAKTQLGLPAGRSEVIRRSRLFLSHLNRKIFGRHGVRRHRFKVGSCAFLGWGIYGDHPHTHWLLAKPTHMTNEDFCRIITLISLTTPGLGRQRDIQQIHNHGVIEYIIGHGFEEWIEQVTFTAKCPVH